MNIFHQKTGCYISSDDFIEVAEIKRSNASADLLQVYLMLFSYSGHLLFADLVQIQHARNYIVLEWFSNTKHENSAICLI